MSWSVVASKDVHDASRSRTIWLLFGLLAVLFVGFAAAQTYLGEQGFVPFLDGLTGLVGALLPVIGLLLGYKSVADERASGSLFLTLSFPVSRRDVVVGTFVGRTIVLLAPTVVGLVLAGIAGIVLYGSDGAALYPWFVLVTALYGVAFVGIGIGLSMATTVDRWITFGALGGYLVLVQLWDSLNTTILLILHRFDFAVLQDVPDWALLLRLAGPAESYDRLVRAGFDVGRAGLYASEDAPAYVDAWMAVLLLVAWTVVPVLVGFWRFRTADL